MPTPTLAELAAEYHAALALAVPARNALATHPEIAAALRSQWGRVATRDRGDVPQEACLRFLKRLAACSPTQVDSPEKLLAIAHAVAQESARRLYSGTVREKLGDGAGIAAEQLAFDERDRDKGDDANADDDPAAIRAAALALRARAERELTKLQRDAVLDALDGAPDAAIAASHGVGVPEVRAARRAAQAILRGDGI